MSLCPKCGRVYCDHEPSERGQTYEEMMAPLTEEELAIVKARNRKAMEEIEKKHGIKFVYDDE